MSGLRAREAGVVVGRLSPGKRNAITDVEGVQVRHLAFSAAPENALHTGLTAVLPYGREVRRRKLFLGKHVLGGERGMTGLQVAEDFKTFSSPVVLTSLANLGRVYNACIFCGHRRDAEFSLDAGWPPVVLGLNDGYLSDPLAAREAADEQAVVETLEAKEAPVEVEEGSVGVGRGLVAFGLKGGVGTASRIAAGSGRRTVGALVAAHGGRREDFRIGGVSVGEKISLPAPAMDPTETWAAAVAATDAPLLPFELDRLAAHAMAGLVRCGFSEGIALAFSTRNAQDGVSGGKRRTYSFEGAAEGALAALGAAAAEASEEAVLNALLQAEAAKGRAGRRPEALPAEEWENLLS